MADEGSLARIFAAQHGLISRAQAKAAGLTDGGIRSRVAAGRWTRAAPRVFRLTSSPVTWEQELVAVCLRLPSAVVSRGAAAALLGLDGFEAGNLTFTVRSGRHVTDSRITVHRNSSLRSCDVLTRGCLPYTNGTRTLIDLSGSCSPETLEIALDSALRQRLTSLRQLEWRLGLFENRIPRGASALRQLLADRAGGPEIESVLETRVWRILRRLPVRPARQHWVLPGIRVDFAYPRQKVAVECDGRRFHSGRREWEAGLRRRNDITRAGWTVIHVVWSDLDRSQDILERVAEALTSTAPRDIRAGR